MEKSNKNIAIIVIAIIAVVIAVWSITHSVSAGAGQNMGHNGGFPSKGQLTEQQNSDAKSGQPAPPNQGSGSAGGEELGTAGREERK